MADIPNWLNFGSFGLLALILVGLGMYAQKFLNRWLDNQKAVLNHQAEAERETDAFLRDLIDKDREERRQQLASWQSLVAQDIEAKQALTKALQEICQRSDRHEQRAAERHKKLMLQFEQQPKQDLT